MTYKAFKNGEEWAFSKIYTRFHKPILKYISDRVKDPEVAQDLTQETFLKVYRFKDSFELKQTFSTWLWTIARNTISDWYRKNGSESNLLELLPDDLPSERPSAEAILVKASEKKKLRKLLSKLTGAQRRVIWLRVIHHLSYQEIASRLGLSLSAVKCLAYRSKRILFQAGEVPAFA